MAKHTGVVELEDTTYGDQKNPRSGTAFSSNQYSPHLVKFVAVSLWLLEYIRMVESSTPSPEFIRGSRYWYEEGGTLQGFRPHGTGYIVNYWRTKWSF